MKGDGGDSMHPRHLYFATFAWLVFSGGRFTAPFLEQVAGFNESQTGFALALQSFLTAALSSAAGSAADRLEARRPGRGRLEALVASIGLGTAVILMHGVVSRALGGDTRLSVVVHTALRGLYAVALATAFPVMDGITLASLKDSGKGREEYGKERFYGECSLVILRRSCLLFI